MSLADYLDQRDRQDVFESGIANFEVLSRVGRSYQCPSRRGKVDHC